MIQRTRMFKVLAILAVSMTATTVLLSRLEPAASRTLPYPFLGQLRQVVHSAVASAELIAPESWRGVEIVLEREVAALPHETLAAIPDSGDYHFWIGNTGAVASSPAWRQQHPAAARAAIRIALADPQADSTIPPRQWAALHMLLGELKGMLEPAGASAPTGRWVTLSDQAAGDPELLAHLRLEGLLG